MRRYSLAWVVRLVVVDTLMFDNHKATTLLGTEQFLKRCVMVSGYTYVVSFYEKCDGFHLFIGLGCRTWVIVGDNHPCYYAHV